MRNPILRNRSTSVGPVLLLALSCTDDVASLAPGSGGDTGAAPDAVLVADAAPGGDATVDDLGAIIDVGSFPDAMAPGDGGQPDAGPTRCGGFAGRPCPNGFYCDYDNNGCGAADGPGICRPRPQGCTDEVDPACGCDGMIYGNPCEANAAGFDLNAGGCPTPPGQYACGWRVCTLADQYCQQGVSDVIGIPDDFQCLPTPARCGGPATCACLADEPCGDICVIQLGGPRVVCPGG